MIALATGTPTAAVEGEHVIITIPSGKGDVQIAVTPNQAIHLHRAVRNAAFDVLDDSRTSADVIRFKEAV